MLRKVAILTDSTCCLPQELVERYHIHVVPLLIIHEGKSYRDGIDISPGEVYRIMRRRKDLPTTSTPSAGDFLEAYRQLSQTAESILCITLTSLQSGVFETASAAREVAREVIPNTPIEVLDSRSVAGALGFIVLEAARSAGQGAELAQVLKVAQEMMSRVNFLAVLDTLFYLARTGRIARAAAWASSLLNVKPIVEHSPSVGETVPVARPRIRTKAIEQMLEIMWKRVGSSRIHVAVHHADEPEEGEKLRAEIESRFNCVELYLTEFTPSMGVHAGPGLLAISFYAEREANPLEMT
ncbi:MAG: DegV family protein [Chloroflexi bacterium]|nr:MAG: DegV family protein [Chloroflexota bacterium]